MIGLILKKKLNCQVSKEFIKMVDEEYFSLSAVSASGLKQFDKSPAHYKAYIENKQKFKKAFLDGRIAHAKILEGKEPKLIESMACRSNDDKANILSFFQDHLNKDQLEECFPGGKVSSDGRDQAFDLGGFYCKDDYEAILKMAESVKANKYGKFITGKPERSELVGVVDCPNTGLKLKAKYDFIPSSGSVIFDLKTIAEIKPDKIKWQLKDFGYHLQACHYLNVAKLMGHEYNQFFFIFVEKKAPYGVVTVKLKDEFLDDCMNYYHTLLENFALCKKLDDFSRCYDDEIIEVDFNLY